MGRLQGTQPAPPEHAAAERIQAMLPGFSPPPTDH